MLVFIDGKARQMTADETAAFEAKRGQATASLDDYKTAVIAHIEAAARSGDYSSASSCAGYVASTVPKWASEARAFIAWRDAVFTQVFAVLDQVRAGEPAPGLADLLAALPPMRWS